MSCEKIVLKGLCKIQIYENVSIKSEKTKKKKKLKTSMFPMFANFQWVGSSAEHSAEGMQCILKCNQICWTFFKDATLWSHSTPLHHPLLCPIMLPSKEKRKKMFYQSDLSSYWTPTSTTCIPVLRRLLLHHSKTNPPRRRLLCLHSTNCNTTKERGEVGVYGKSPMMPLINFTTDKQYKQQQFYGQGWIREFPLNRIRWAPLLRMVVNWALMTINMVN